MVKIKYKDLSGWMKLAIVGGMIDVISLIIIGVFFLIGIMIGIFG